MERKNVKVVFRFDEKAKETVAIFSNSIHEEQYGLWTAYVHNGQHTTASTEYIHTRTRLATEEEYNLLLQELDRRGYNVTIRKRLSYI